MSTRFDIAWKPTYRGGMFTIRMRSLLTSVSRRVDVMPDTLVFRAWEGAEPSARSRA